MKRLFVFDIDETLYDNSTCRFPSDTVGALSSLQKLGHVVVVATGRPPCKAKEIYGAGIRPDFLITNNGHCILDKDGDVFWERRVDKNLGIEITDYSLDNGLGLIWSYHDKIYIYSMCEAFLHILDRNMPFLGSMEPCGIHLEKNPLGGCIGAEKEKIDAFRDKFRGRMDVVGINDKYGDLVLAGASKFEALKMLLSYLSIPISATMAFGDNNNDEEMLNGCGIGVCMGNGTEDLKRSADYVTTGVGERGIVNALEHFGVL
ncbi:MAG: HAD family hydrolase [Candidatus Ornithospirochaeta sp.]